jgi:hypothetical protein
MQTSINMLVFLLRYQEPCKVLTTNPRWCPYAKGSSHNGKHPIENSIDSYEPFTCGSGASLSGSLG